MKSILRQTLAGVHHLHAHGILHRDIKPNNLIVSLTPRECDEGFADDHASRENSGVSSPGRMSSARSASVSRTARSPVLPVRGWTNERRTGRRRRKAHQESSYGDGDEGADGAGGSREGAPPIALKVADFSSAIDEGSIKAGLYGSGGPSQQEETLQYAPPEVLFSAEVNACSVRLWLFSSSGVQYMQ